MRQFALSSNKEHTAFTDSAFLIRIKALDIPNKLTISRMLAIPLFCGAFQLGLVRQAHILRQYVPHNVNLCYFSNL